ncbi:methyl-accepting chemotaxis protein [Acetobacterium sp.]|uniref:methyl-accepting chemotaxis protein n=1 Tax=Acetobacterium sp. TaxID=1872094 RepID=UPI002F3E658E
MEWINNMKISAKLLSGFIIVAIIAAIVGIVGIVNIKALDDSDTALYENITVPVSQIGQISTAFQTMRVNLRDMILANDPQSIKINADKIAERRAQIDAVAAEFEKTILSDNERAAFDEFINARNGYNGHLDQLTNLAAQNLDAEAFLLMSPDSPAGKATVAEQDAIAKIVAMKVEAAKATADSNIAQGNSTILIMIIITIMGALIAIGLGLFLSSIIVKPLKKANHMIKEMSMGHLGLRLNMDSSDEIGEMAIAMDSLADNLQNQVIGTINRISNGDVSANIEINDVNDEITPALKQTIESIRGLITEANMLSRSAVEGRLDTRANAAAFKGGFKEILEGVNDTLDAVVGPLNMASEAIAKIGKGQIPPKITVAYSGDFNELKNNLNACINGLGALVEGNKILGQMSVNDFTDKIEGEYLGIYNEISKSINVIHWKLGHIVSIATNIAKGDMQDLEDLKQTGKRSEQDNLMPSLILMIENVNLLVTETEGMARIAIAGDLNHRGDASQFPGEYARVIKGFNETLDVIIAPIKEASDVLKELADGNLDTSMTGDYKGHHAKIKEDMNQTIKFLKRIVTEVTQILEQIGKRNLDQEITGYYNGDFVNIKLAINDITTSLSEIMSDIDVASNQVDSGARQISDGGQALSQGTTEQASSIEELTASISEVAEETKRNAIHANEANELAIDVRTNAELGNKQMKEMVSAMVGINDSSKNISKIIKVIDDIAFQTNILALNAAVEAARAGQHGKGFAVVAEEVRSLAARSAEAAKETTGLIEGSIDKVEMGTKIADQTAESLKEILGRIEKVAGLVGNIAQASNDQASEIAQITQGIEQVSQVVQTNSATAEESAAASEELSGQSEMLKEMVGTFKIKHKSRVGAGMKEKAAPKAKLQKEKPAPGIILNDDEGDKY